MHPRFWWLATAACALIAGCADRPDVSKSRDPRIDAIFSRFQRPGSPGVAVGIYSHGKLIYLQGYGSADLEHGIPITADTVFNLASLSKQFTAFSIALLARDGKLDLNADVRTYLKDFPDFGAKITVADLVHHISGVRDYLTLAGLRGIDEAGLIRQSFALQLIESQRALNSDPGTQFEYSNSGYVLLAQIVESVSGQTLREFMAERIFQPLGMTHTRLHDDLTRIESNYAAGYAISGADGVVARAVYNHETVGPGNVLSTVGDMALWAANFGHPRIGDPAFIDQLSAPAKLRNGTPVNYGFGLGRDELYGHRLVRHDGEIPGFSSTFLYFPEDDFAIVLLFNHVVEPAEFSDAIAKLYLKPETSKSANSPSSRTEENAAPAGSQERAVGVPAAALQKMAGRYASEELAEVYELAVNGSGNPSAVRAPLLLKAMFLEQPQELWPTAQDRFETHEGPLRGLAIHIERDTEGEPRALLVDFYDIHSLRFEKIRPR